MDPSLPPLLVVMCGISFAGKTTLARAIVAARGWRYVALDDVHGELGFGAGGHGIALWQWEQGYGEACGRIAACLQQGESVVYDEVNKSRRQRDQLRALAAGHHAAACIVHVATPTVEARLRWMRNRAAPVRGDVRTADFISAFRHFQPPGPDEPVIRYHAPTPIQPWIDGSFPRGRAPRIAPRHITG